MRAVSDVTYANGVVLHARTAEGWRVTDTDGTEYVLPTIPAFMVWCEERYGWPMPM